MKKEIEIFFFISFLVSIDQPFNPSINMISLLTALHVFQMVQVGEICVNIKRFDLW